MVTHDSAAIVLGASISGLLAARALSPHFQHVTLVERDHLTGHAAVRKGTPQAAHAHGLLACGYRIMEEYFPGMMNELEALGAPRGDVAGDFLWFQYGRWKLRHQSGIRGITVTRPCLETAVRHRVSKLPNVAILDGTEGIKPVFDIATGRVTGLMVRRQPGSVEEKLEADLVVDASGRGSRSAKWLEEWGFGRPETSSVKVSVGYATRIFERRPGELFDSYGAVISPIPPTQTRLGAVLAAEESRWLISLGGMLGDYPPAEEQAWLRFAASLSSPIIHDLAAAARPLSDIVTYRFPANERRHYERLKRFPEGYLIIGDAVCSFNPIYGQGMSVAAAEAKVLDEVIGTGAADLGRRFYARTRKLIDTPWLIATGEDLRFPEVEGARPLTSRIINHYLDRVHSVASYDEKVCRKFFDVLNLLAPPDALISPGVAWRVFTQRMPPGQKPPVEIHSMQGHDQPATHHVSGAP